MKIALLLTAGLALVAGLAASPFLLQPPDPVHQGRKASAWIAALEGAGEEPQKAKTALLEMGAEAIPQVAACLKESRSPLASRSWYRAFRAQLTRWLGAPPHQPPSPRVRMELLQMAPEFGPAAGKLVPVLAATIGDTDQGARHFAIQSLGKMGSVAEKAAPVILKTLSSSDHVARRLGVLALARIGANYPQQIPAIEGLKRDTNSVVAAFAALALWRLDPGPGREEELRSLLNNADEATRVTLIHLLATIGAAPARAIALIEAQTHSQSEKVAAAATNALQRLRNAEGAKKLP